MRTPRLLAALPLLAAAAPSPPLTPGVWEHTLVYALDSVNGSADVAEHMQSALPTPRPTRDCYTADELRDPSRFLLDGSDRRCRFSRIDMTGGKLSAAGDCTDAGRAMHVEGTGTYSATGYDFSFTGTGETNGLRLAFRGRDSGRRIAACPAA
jgi:hypothetical protein